MENRPQKIIIISPAYPYRGGIAATTDRLAQEYLSRGEEVEVWTYKMLYPKLIFPGKTQFVNTDIQAPPSGVTIKRKINAGNYLNWIKVRKALKKAAADKVIIRYWIPFLAPCLGTIAHFKRPPHTKVICLADNVIPHEKRRGDTILSRFFFRKMDGFVVMAKQGIEQLEQIFHIKKPIIYSPHPLFDIYGTPVSKKEAAKELGLDPDTPFILSFGLVRKYKGVDLLIESFAHFSKNHPQHKLIIVGECYDDWSVYQQLIDKHHLQDKIVRVDQFIPDEKVKYYFSIADFIALTYRSATQSGVTQIAYSMELPMLVTAVGDLSNMVKSGTSGLVCETDIPSITDALETLSKEENLALYRKGVKDEKKRFSWSTLCDNLDRL
ncbi:MAG: glycosyltransferase [Crocinitomicaceae bacterium]